MPCPWQIYLFGLTNLCGILFPFFDVCSFFSGKESCNSTEHFMTFMMGYCITYLGVLLLVLTWMNHGDTPKTKRLAMIATNCAAVMFAAIVMTGSSKLNGFEIWWLHWGDMIWFLLMYIFLAGATADDSPVVGVSESPWSGMGVNCKTLLLLFVIATLLKLFAWTDIVNFSWLLRNPDEMSELALCCWHIGSAAMFEILLVFWFALVYGNEKDHEGVVFSIVGLTIVGIFYMIPVFGAYKEGLLMAKGLPSVIVLIVISIIAVIVGRRQRSYQELP